MKNKITSSSVAGIYIFISINNIISENKFENNYFGLQLEDTQETNTFKQNNISNNTVGIFLGRSCNNIIFENNITNNIEYGFYIVESSNNNFIYHNNIIFNNISGFDICVNIWNDSYPFGGNYGSDYSGIDIYHGPNQNIPGSDGIGDTPYELPCEYATDYYPFMEPDGWINHPPNKPEKPNGTKKEKLE